MEWCDPMFICLGMFRQCHTHEWLIVSCLDNISFIMIEMICCLDKILSWTPGAHDKQHIMNAMMCPNNTHYEWNDGASGGGTRVTRWPDFIAPAVSRSRHAHTGREEQVWVWLRAVNYCEMAYGVEKSSISILCCIVYCSMCAWMETCAWHCVLCLYGRAKYAIGHQKNSLQFICCLIYTALEVSYTTYDIIIIT